MRREHIKFIIRIIREIGFSHIALDVTSVRESQKRYTGTLVILERREADRK